MKKQFIVTCYKCGKSFEVIEDESKFPIKTKYFCSRSCANTRTLNDETKNKISKGLKKYNEIHNNKKPFYICGSKILNDIHKEISKHKILTWFNVLIPFGFDINSIGTTRIIDEYYKCKNIIYCEYTLNRLSPKDIYIKYNCNKHFNHSERILHLIKLFGFKHRTCSEAVSNAILQGKCLRQARTKYVTGWHTTWFGKKVFLRSSYEFNFAKELDDKKIFYEVEFKRIQYFNSKLNKLKIAIPDFYIPNENLIVEIKCKWTYNKQNMDDKFKAYKNLGYNVKLILEGIEYNN